MHFTWGVIAMSRRKTQVYIDGLETSMWFSIYIQRFFFYLFANPATEDLFTVQDFNGDTLAGIHVFSEFNLRKAPLTQRSSQFVLPHTCPRRPYLLRRIITTPLRAHFPALNRPYRLGGVSLAWGELKREKEKETEEENGGGNGEGVAGKI